MHQKIVDYHSAIGAQNIEWNAGVSFHGFYHFADLKGCCFEYGAGDVAFVREAGQASDYAAGAVLPVRSVEAGEGGDEIDSAIVGDGSRERFDI